MGGLPSAKELGITNKQYKSYYLYMIHKKSLNENPLTFTAFKKYYTETVDTIPDYESLCDPSDFE
jgi:hypothetical protein